MFHIQYDKATGIISGTVLGKFTPIVKGGTGQLLFDKAVATQGKIIELTKVEEGKVFEVTKDVDLILKDDPNFNPEIDEEEPK